MSLPRNRKRSETRAVKNPPARRGEGYVQLRELLDDCWDLPMAKLSKEQRESVRAAFAPMAWDDSTPDQRRTLADQLDYQRDPALETERARHWDEANVDWQYWGGLPTLSPSEFVALRLVCDPRKVESQRDIFPGGERPSLGQRIDDDLRRIAADPTVSGKGRLALRQWMEWAERAGLSCPAFMRAHVDADRKASAPKGMAGITPKQFIAKHANYVDGGKPYLDKWFKGRTRNKGEKPAAAAFRIPGAYGQYDEAAMIAALKADKVYSEIR
jgi:hypothetical protein